ncbi:hypothetical protein [Sphingomonas sp. AP4-R1]|uniref:hypothetical protein n=1 Tax=Sphingomonas sp. AP4-R1 TaxID=2735134 RepID=UPI0020A4E792|nr:hypothetical protein [Sphingomonas sp. AP4-R1]
MLNLTRVNSSCIWTGRLEDSWLMATAAKRYDAATNAQFRLELPSGPELPEGKFPRAGGRVKRLPVVPVEPVEQLELRPIPTPPEPAPTPPEPVAQGVQAEPFARWLIEQKARRDWIAELAKAAAADRGFPKNGSPDDVRKRLQALGADGDAFEQVDDAELAWMAAQEEVA